MPRYNPASIEPKWQNFWDKNRTFRTPDFPAASKLYVLDMFPYPSGEGLHVGHPEGYTATDIVARYARMCGKSVFASHGLRRVWIACRRRTRDQDQYATAREHRSQHCQFYEATKNAWLLIRLGSRTGDDRSRILSLDAMDFSSAVRYMV